MSWKNTADFNAWCNRRGERRSALGRSFEIAVEAVLNGLKDRGLVADFVRNQPNSKEDSMGKDFTVRKMVNGQMLERSFGVTISQKSWQVAKHRYINVPQFLFPIGTNPSTIESRILGLF